MRFISKLVVILVFALIAVSSSAAPKEDVKHEMLMGSAPTVSNFIGPHDLIEFTGLRVSMAQWFQKNAQYNPGKTSEEREAVAQFSEALQEKLLIEKIAEGARSLEQANKLPGLKRLVSKLSANVAKVFSRPSIWTVDAVLGEDKTKESISPKSVFCNPEQQFVVLMLPWQGKTGTVKLTVEAYPYGQAKAVPVSLYQTLKKPDVTPAAYESKYEFEVEFINNPNIIDKFEPSNASDVTLIDGTKKSDLKRLDIEMQRIVGGGILNMKGKFSTDSKDLEANFTLGLSARTLKDVSNFRTESYGVQYEINQLGTNQLASVNYGTKFFLQIPIGLTPAGEPGYRSYAEFKAEAGHWIRQDSFTTATNGKKEGVWITGEIGIGPIFVAGGKSAFFAKATGYYFPMKDRTFGNNVNLYEGYIEAGMLIALGISDEDLKAGKGNWLKLSYANGAERANAFANKSSFAITFVTALKF